MRRSGRGRRGGEREKRGAERVEEIGRKDIGRTKSGIIAMNSTTKRRRRRHPTHKDATAVRGVCATVPNAYA